VRFTGNRKQENVFMLTLKDILSRKEECQNLRSVGFCVLIVLTLIIGAFSMVHVKYLVDHTPRYAQTKWVPANPSGSVLEVEFK
jgi:hypothetical protein